MRIGEEKEVDSNQWHILAVYYSGSPSYGIYHANSQSDAERWMARQQDERSGVGFFPIFGTWYGWTLRTKVTETKTVEISDVVQHPC